MAKQTKVRFPVTMGNPSVPKPMDDTSDVPTSGHHQHTNKMPTVFNTKRPESMQEMKRKVEPKARLPKVPKP